MKKAATGGALEKKLLQQVESLKRRIEQLEQESGYLGRPAVEA